MTDETTKPRSEQAPEDLLVGVLRIAKKLTIKQAIATLAGAGVSTDAACAAIRKVTQRGLARFNSEMDLETDVLEPSAGAEATGRQHGLPDHRALDLDAIEARLKAATPGPWVAPHGERIITGSLQSRFYVIADVFPDAGGANCEFIVHAPTDIAALIAAVRERDEARTRGHEDGERHERASVLHLINERIVYYRNPDKLDRGGIGTNSREDNGAEAELVRLKLAIEGGEHIK